VFDLAGGDEFLHCSGHVFDGHVGVDTMLIEKVDHLGPQPLERFLDDYADALGPAVEAFVRVSVNEAEFRGNHYVFAKRLQRLADDFLV
jgi:hypothetical protein